jgi:hypothetical protein
MPGSLIANGTLKVHHWRKWLRMIRRYMRSVGRFAGRFGVFLLLLAVFVWHGDASLSHAIAIFTV